MDLGTIIGLILTTVIIIVVLIMDGGTPAELFAHPSAILLTLGGSYMAAAVSAPFKTALSLPKLLILTVKGVKVDYASAIESLVSMADKARRDGLLALESESQNIDDAFLRKGLMLVVDGVDPAQVKSILHIEIEHMKERHEKGYGILEAAGGYAPTFGIIGTVMGLISVLQQLDQPDKLGKAIAGAFLATLWGLLSSNLIWLPLAGKLKTNSVLEVAYRNMLVEGILALQAGENPRLLNEKLSAFLPPKARNAAEKAPAAKKAGAEA
jgi:chemotaxis protein MotA